MSNPLSCVTEPCLEDPEKEKANLALVFDRYKDKISSLPKEKGWSTENLYLYQGHWYQSSESIISIGTAMASQDTFQANPSDIYLVTLPKSGTTWIKALTFAIVNRTKYNTKNSLSPHPLQVYNPHDCVPFIENEMVRTKSTYIDANSSLRLFATHIPYASLPQSIIDYGCRIVYMYRNPKDVLVSTFHFANQLRDGLITFEEAFHMFINGVSPYGPYWDHVQGYYKVGMEHPTKILFLSYENMKMDTAKNVKHLAEFLGYPFTKDEETTGVVKEIISLCSFGNLSKVNKHGNLRDNVPNHVFFRKGKVGDSSNYFTDEMDEIFDKIMKEQFRGLDVSFSDKWNHQLSHFPGNAIDFK